MVPVSWRHLAQVFIITLAVATVSGTIAGFGFPIFVEAGVLEQIQSILWALIAAVGLFLTVRQTRIPDLAAMFLFSVLAVAASAREFDAHVLLNPESLGGYGVRFRLRWWLDPEVSFMLKFVWLTIGATMLTLVVVPLWFSRGPLIRAVRRREPIAWLFGAVGVLMVIGMICDDVLRYRVPLAVTQRIEEVAETFAPVAYFLAILIFHWSASKGWKVDESPTPDTASAAAETQVDDVETPMPMIDTTGVRHTHESDARRT